MHANWPLLHPTLMWAQDLTCTRSNCAMTRLDDCQIREQGERVNTPSRNIPSRLGTGREAAGWHRARRCSLVLASEQTSGTETPLGSLVSEMHGLTREPSFSFFLFFLLAHLGSARGSQNRSSESVELFPDKFRVCLGQMSLPPPSAVLSA